MTVPRLTSKDNTLLKEFRLVSAGGRRAPEDLVAAEGVRVLEEAERSSFVFEAVVISEQFGAIPRERQLLQRLQSKKTRLYQLAGNLFQSISTVRAPQGIAALVRVPKIALDSITLPRDALILCACGIQDPGNLGTLIRTAAAAGAALVCTTPGTVSARNPKTTRSSAGSFFRIPIAEHVNFQEFRRYSECRSMPLYRTDAKEGIIYTAADLKSGCAVLLGNEGSGFTEEEFSGLPAIRIPIAKGVESLNVATAGAVILFEARRQRGGF